MKRTISVLALVAVLAIACGCTRISSDGEYTLGDGTFVSKEKASLVIKVVGDSENTGISFFFVDRDDEEYYTSDSSLGSSESLLDNKFKKNVTSHSLPWETKLTIEADQALYIQVKPRGSNDDVTVEIWKDGQLQKEFVAINKMFPFWTSYRL